MMKEAKRLHDLGFGIHWIRPRSKLPVEAGWTTGPRKPWDYLKKTYQSSYNLGVRLGRASQMPRGFLSVIDCDVKSEDPKHCKEMLAKLETIYDVYGTPISMSGRGNGSRHLFVVTKEPTKTKRLAQSSEKVKVLMPSVEPTKKERETFTEKQLKFGYRLRYAWEISFMGEGSQVVLPPSIHPDSGKNYVWSVPFTGQPLPIFDNVKVPSQSREPESPSVEQKGIAFVSVDLVGSKLSHEVVDLILNGTGCEDRSAALFKVAIHMLKLRFTDTDILSVLTDKDTFLGQASFDHAKTSSRNHAAQWVRKYTLEKAKLATSAARDFEEEAVTVTLDDDAAETQAVEITETDWRNKLDRAKGPTPGVPGKVLSTLKNINLILKNEVGSDVFRKNLFSGTDVYGVKPPWNRGKVGDEIRDIDVTNLIHWLVGRWKFEASDKKLYQTIAQIASENPFHPVRDYLASLEWDGVPRLDSWLKTYLGATAPEPYLSAVSRKLLCAMVARVNNPGVKFDQVVILEGDQGIGKSTAVRILADPWFTDAHINIADKDATVTMRSVWLMEMGELSGMRKADVDQLKEFVSRQVDRIRLPYGRLAEDFPRQCVFVGTTNSTEYLKDATGNRRFWPVKVGRCNLVGLRAVRDQLLAEAVFAWELGEPLYLETDEMNRAAVEEQESRVWQDEWVGVIGDFLAKKETPRFNKNSFSVTDLFGDDGGLPGTTSTVQNLMRAGAALKVLGYTKERQMHDGIRKKMWVKKCPT